MKKIVSFILIVLLLTFSGCNYIIKSMDRGEVTYNKKIYTAVSPPYWSMNNEDDYTIKLIEADNIPLHIRLYNNDVDNIFFYIEEDGLLFHDNSDNFPKNSVNDIDFIEIVNVQTSKTIELNNTDLLREFISILSDESVSYVRSYNIASIVIYYNDYPANYFLGNIMVDKKGQYWIYLNHNDQYVKLDENSKLSSLISSEYQS